MLFSVLLTACTPAQISPESPAPATEQDEFPTTPVVKIKWAFWGDPWEVEINQNLVKVFEADHPDIKVETIHTSWDEYFKKADEWLAGDNPPDVMFFDFVPVYAARGKLENLSPYIKQDGFDIQDIYSGLLQY